LAELKINNRHKLITLNIKDLYANIPIKETIDITRAQLLQNNDKQTTNQIITLLEVILGQNYFSFQDQIYQPEKGIAMGSPIWNNYLGMLQLFILSQTDGIERDEECEILFQQECAPPHFIREYKVPWNWFPNWLIGRDRPATTMYRPLTTIFFCGHL
jgi:hypothetical protein